MGITATEYYIIYIASIKAGEKNASNKQINVNVNTSDG